MIQVRAKKYIRSTARLGVCYGFTNTSEAEKAEKRANAKLICVYPPKLA